MEGGQLEVAGFIFSNNFDSGNLAHVQLASGPPDPESDHQGLSPRAVPPSLSRPSTSTAQPRSAGTDSPDYEFHLWTRPDCQGSEFENGNRTWFYFGLRGGPPGAVLKFTVQNLNKQSKLFSQGMVPVFMIPGRTTWERLRDLPTYSTQENNFSMSFKFRNLEEPDSQVYFAFTYPYTYKELQANLAKLEKKYSMGHLDYAGLQGLPSTGIYFHRELVTRSLEHRRLDLLTISGLNNVLEEKEPMLANLFPEQSSSNRPHKFSNKKVVFLSARVHPGETCSSFVMNGFIKFLLNPSDARAAALRSKYVFKLVPMLNPDGVYRGHYRTDTRGVNLNRVYSDPSLQLHPTIYAAKMLVLLAHMGVDCGVENSAVEPEEIIKNDDAFEFDKAADVTEFSDVTEDSSSACPLSLPPMALTEPEWYKPLSLWDLGRNTNTRGRTSTSSRVSNSSRTSHSSTMSGQGPSGPSPVKGELALHWYEMTETSRCSEGDESVADFSVPSFGIGALLGGVGSSHHKEWDDSAFLPPDFPSSSSSRRSSEARTTFSGAFKQQAVKPTEDAEKVVPPVDPILCSAPPADPPTTPPPFTVSDIPIFKPQAESGLFLYVDIHGHASKRGIFMYGNHFDELETKVSALLYPKLMSINSANFDFPACNFTARNMFLKDRHTGAGKEGSGRVSVYKATGLTYCYTLECNFNTGRHTNSVPLSSRDCGRASPPPSYDHPPKYSPGIYEDCGRYMAISILDLTDSNPWTRLPCSSCKNVKGVKAWIRQYLKSAEAESALKASKSSKSSPMRTRLRSLSSTKKSPLKQLKLLKSPSSPEISTGSTSNQARPLSKLPRKAISPKHTQSVPGKLSRQNSRVKSAKVVEGTKKKKRIGSGKKLKGTRPASKTGSRTGSKPSSRSGSRASSPRRTKLEPKVTKIGLQKKALQKAAWKTLDDQANPDPSFSMKKVKRKKKRVPTTAPS